MAKIKFRTRRSGIFRNIYEKNTKPKEHFDDYSRCLYFEPELVLKLLKWLFRFFMHVFNKEKKNISV